MSVDIAKYRKMSPEEREEYMFEIWGQMRSDIQKINTGFDNESPLIMLRPAVRRLQD